jgi:hypothetical protein
MIEQLTLFFSGIAGRDTQPRFHVRCRRRCRVGCGLRRCIVGLRVRQSRRDRQNCSTTSNIGPKLLDHCTPFFPNHVNSDRARDHTIEVPVIVDEMVQNWIKFVSSRVIIKKVSRCLGEAAAYLRSTHEMSQRCACRDPPADGDVAGGQPALSAAKNRCHGMNTTGNVAARNNKDTQSLGAHSE